jgi:hypothetical protein
MKEIWIMNIKKVIMIIDKMYKFGAFKSIIIKKKHKTFSHNASLEFIKDES